MKKWLSSIMIVGLVACGTPDEEPTEPTADGRVSLPDGFGKSDNYIATNASEFILSGEASFSLPDDFTTLDATAQDERLEELATSRTGDITRAARSRIDELVRAANDRLREEHPDAGDELVKYFIYVKSAYDGGRAENIVVDGDRATFRFEMELVGSLELIEIVDGEQADQTFEVELSGTDAPETVAVSIDASPSTDSFPRYDALFEDGVYDIAIIFGGDYNEERYDIETARWTVDFLIENGWQNEAVSTFDELRHDSPPFTMALLVEGREVEARVQIVHAQMDDDAGTEQSLLRELVEEAILERDVIIYSGHAGANAGMILDYHPRYELDDDEFDDVAMSSKYQIYVFDGCNSYRTYVDKLMLNEARTWENTTAVTTVNTTPFSAGYEIIHRFVHWLTLTSEDGTHFPVSWNTLLREVNDQHPDVYYGVHGVDQDPKLNPHAADGFMCQSCETNDDCGAGANYCVDYEGGSACAVACTDSSACGEGYECAPLFDDPDLFYIPKQCVRTSLTCG